MEKIKLKLKNRAFGEYLKASLLDAIRQVKENPELKKAYGLPDDYENMEIEIEVVDAHKKVHNL
ncbi:MAG: hypothetical protein V1676_03575 [Candidatus Diapherotrites archaeon]